MTSLVGTLAHLRTLSILQTSINNLRSGRQYAFNLTCLISSVFGLCLGAPSTYNGILVLTAFTGFGVGGNIPIDTTICLEFIPQVNTCLSPQILLLTCLESTISPGAVVNLSALGCSGKLGHCLRIYTQILLRQWTRWQDTTILQQRSFRPSLLY